MQAKTAPLDRLENTYFFALFCRGDADAIAKNDGTLGFHGRMQSTLLKNNFFSTEGGENQVQIHSIRRPNVLRRIRHIESQGAIGPDLCSDDLYSCR